MAPSELREIGIEPFGSKVRRARVAVKLTLDEAHARVNLVYPASRRSIARLEEDTELPGGNRQLLAYVVLLAYGVDPGSVGFGESTAERLINRDEILRMLPPLESITSIRWYYGTQANEAA